MKRLFFNPHTTSSEKAESAYRQQLRYLKKAWRSDTYGLERLLRLFLCLVQFIYPIILIREIFGRMGGTARKLAVEFYIFFKFCFPLLVLFFGWYRYPVAITVIIYFLSETILHILNLIFLSEDIEGLSLSYHRAILVLLLNYLEVVLGFAAIYIAFDLLSEPLNPISAVYFSMVSSTTVGFGDICAKGNVGQIVVILQLLVCLSFIVVFINYFSQKANPK